jgi:hypothetical protein
MSGHLQVLNKTRGTFRGRLNADDREVRSLSQSFLLSLSGTIGKPGRLTCEGCDQGQEQRVSREWRAVRTVT